jgi:hypothetical protein
VRAERFYSAGRQPAGSHPVSERFNKFVQWVAFGGDSVIAENVHDEQRKLIKYNYQVANLLAFHNIVAMTNAARRMEVEGFEAL